MLVDRGDQQVEPVGRIDIGHQRQQLAMNIVVEPLGFGMDGDQRLPILDPGEQFGLHQRGCGPADLEVAGAQHLDHDAAIIGAIAHDRAAARQQFRLGAGKAHLAGAEAQEGDRQGIVAGKDGGEGIGVEAGRLFGEAAAVDDPASAEAVAVGAHDLDRAGRMFGIDQDRLAVAPKQGLGRFAPLRIDDFGHLTERARTHILPFQRGHQADGAIIQAHLASARLVAARDQIGQFVLQAAPLGDRLVAPFLDLGDAIDGAAAGAGDQILHRQRIARPCRRLQPVALLPQGLQRLEQGAELQGREPLAMVEQAGAERGRAETGFEPLHHAGAGQVHGLEFAGDHGTLAGSTLRHGLGEQAVLPIAQCRDLRIAAADVMLDVVQFRQRVAPFAQIGDQRGPRLDHGGEAGGATGDILPFQQGDEAGHEFGQRPQRVEPPFQLMHILLDVAIALDALAQLADVDVVPGEQEIMHEALDRAHILERQGHDEGADEAIRIAVAPAGEQLAHIFADMVARAVGANELGAGRCAGLLQPFAHQAPGCRALLPAIQMLDQQVGIHSHAGRDIAADHLCILDRGCLDAQAHAYRRAQAVGIVERQHDVGDGFLAQKFMFVELAEAIAA